MPDLNKNEIFLWIFLVSKVLVFMLKKCKKDTNKVVKEIPIVNALVLVWDMSFVSFTV